MIAVKRELRIGIGVLLVLQILMALGAIGLFSRLVPAIDQILQENVHSIESAERMLVVLALHDERGGAELDPDFRQALDRARSNVTEEAEEPILDGIELGAAELVAGDPLARARVVQALEELVGVNRDAMRQTRDRASRLSEAGAWAAVLFAMLAFSAGVVVALRIQRRVVEPLDELFATARAVKAGDPFRRCQPRGARGELRQLMAMFNELLDERFPERNDEGRESAASPQRTASPPGT